MGENLLCLLVVQSWDPHTWKWMDLLIVKDRSHLGASVSGRVEVSLDFLHCRGHLTGRLALLADDIQQVPGLEAGRPQLHSVCGQKTTIKTSALIAK